MLSDTELNKNQQLSISKEDVSFRIPALKLSLHSTVNNSLLLSNFRCIVPEYGIVHEVDAFRMPEAKPSFSIKHPQVIISMMFRRKHLYLLYTRVE